MLLTENDVKQIADGRVAKERHLVAHLVLSGIFLTGILLGLFLPATLLNIRPLATLGYSLLLLRFAILFVFLIRLERMQRSLFKQLRVSAIATTIHFQQTGPLPEKRFAWRDALNEMVNPRRWVML